MNSITITYGSTTQSLQDWGFTYCTLHLRSRAASTLILDTAGGNPALAAAIPYGAWMTVQIAMGDSSTYTFAGKRRDFNARAHPEAPATSMQFEDVWGALERTTFQHYWAMSNGAGGTTNKYFSRLNLFQDISAGPDTAWTYLTADKQIRQIIAFAQTQCGLPVQCGETDPIWNMPVFAVKAISCAYALQLVMKPMPDLVTKTDYSTNPPTIHFIARQNCQPVTLPFAGTDGHGRHHKQTDIKPRPDLQVPAVVIQYQITGTYNGVNYNDAYVDAYPPNSTGLGENALVFAVDLRGPNQTLVKATLVAEAIDPTNAAFWQKIKPDLADPNIGFDPVTPVVDTTIVNSGNYLAHPDGVHIYDEHGNFFEFSDYPNKLVSGQPAEWMNDAQGDPIEGYSVTIRATLKYVKNLPLTTLPAAAHKVDKHVVECRLRLTQSPVGSTTYTTVGSRESGDPIPLHLAYVIWCSVNNVAVNYVAGAATPPAAIPNINLPENLQWEGTHEIVENTIYSIITPANTLNLAGGNGDWTLMNAVIYAVDIDWFKGATAIQFGPFKHLQAAEYFEMVMAFRYRQTWDNPNLRNSGQTGSAGQADLGKDSPKENTTEGIPQQPLHSVSSPNQGDATQTNFVQHDAANNGGQIIVQTLKPDATVNTEYPQVQLANTDLGVDEDGNGRVAKWRLFGCCSASGVPQQAYIASSDPEDVT